MTYKMILIEPLTPDISIPSWSVVDLDSADLGTQVHELLECRCFDCVDVLVGFGARYCLLVDDDGLLRPDWTPNVPAWYWYSHFNENAPIAGKALVCKEGFDSDGAPDVVGLDPYDLELLSLELENLQKLCNSPS